MKRSLVRMSAIPMLSLMSLAMGGCTLDGQLEDHSISSISEGLTGSYTILQSDILTADLQNGTSKSSGDRFGDVVAVSGDLLAVGAPWETYLEDPSDPDSPVGSGVVHLYRKDISTGGWVFEAKLKPDVRQYDVDFGASVAVSGDLVVVGAAYDKSDLTGVTTQLGVNKDGTSSSYNSGAVYVFRRVNSQWQQEAYIKHDTPAAYDYFGRTVATDDYHIIIGAPEREITNSNGTWTDAGVAYVYENGSSGWYRRKTLKNPSPGHYEYFGYMMALQSDKLAISETRGNSKGAVHVYTRTVNGSWGSRNRIYRSDSDTGDYSNSDIPDFFGQALAFNDDASVLAIGAPWEDSAIQIVNGEVVTDPTDDSLNDSGAVFVYRWDSALAEHTYEAMLKAPNAGKDDAFGRHLAAYGSEILASSMNEDSSKKTLAEDNNSASSAGAVYGFSFDGTAWNQTDYLKSENPQVEGYFGNGLSLQSGQAIVGAAYEDFYQFGAVRVDSCGLVYSFE